MSNSSPGAGLIAGGSVGGTSGIHDDVTSTGTRLAGNSTFRTTSEILSTSIGTITLTNVNDQINTGAFEIPAVPEPSTYVTGLLTAPALTALRRRNRELVN